MKFKHDANHEVISSKDKICHKLVKEVAQKLALEFFEIAASDDEFYKAYKNPIHGDDPKWKDAPRLRFLKYNWKHFIGYARLHLTQLMTMPNISEQLREEIYEALLLEGAMKNKKDYN